ncbi:MAG: hypothetical protein J7K26_03665 [Candidatus Aenigmarchaeota archaeon]|nr:hypothetical protein [Candidatus Aenigmarchaeota archaeon]
MWAKTKLLIHDDLLRPLPETTIELGNVDVEKLYKEIPKLAMSVFKLSEDQIQEKEFKWQKGEATKIKVKWELDKDLDKFSYYWIEIKMSGSVSKSAGNIKITISPALRTEYPQDTWWHRSLFYEILRMFWHTVFYTSKRDQYKKEGRRLVILFIDKIKEFSRR